MSLSHASHGYCVGGIASCDRFAHLPSEIG
jgi:hypothetical protein